MDFVLKIGVFYAKYDGCYQQASAARPDWGGELVVRMTRDLIAQFVLPYLSCTSDMPADTPPLEEAGDWVAVEADPPPEASASTVGFDAGSNLRAWAAHKRSLAMEVCQAQAEDDRSTHKKRRTAGAEGGGGGLEGLAGLTGAALKEALLAKHRRQFVQAAD